MVMFFPLILFSKIDQMSIFLPLFLLQNLPYALNYKPKLASWQKAIYFSKNFSYTINIIYYYMFFKEVNLWQNYVLRLTKIFQLS